ncbi:MAG TPA: T9SS type A sorting domain-containing protein [Bacteroidia bacterium]|nr:T9SS type A sorting domain-containing protein [Bacteroidia bacterium]
MKKNYILGIFAALMLAFMMPASANVTVRSAGGGTCLDIAPGGYTTLTNIIFTEVSSADFAVQSGTTLILTAPAGFEFLAGAGSVTFTAGMDITSASMVVTTSTITVTLNIPTNTKMDVLKIRNIQARATSANAFGKILRTATGGTATIAGDAAGAGIDHGSLTAKGLGGTFTSVSPGNWSNPAIWSGGSVPSCTDNVVINHTVNSDISASVNNLTINTGGNLIADNAITVGSVFTMNGTATYTHNNTTDASTTIFAGTESFSSTSSLILQKWYDRNVPVANSVSGDFGNVTFAYSGLWNQDGMFAPAHIKGTLTVSSGTINLDDGTGMTTALTLQDVVVTSAGNLFIQTGTARDLTLITGNFTDNSTASGLTAIAYKSVGNFNWTVNGNLNLSHKFSMLEGVVATDIGSATVNITGNLLINGAQFDGMKSVTGPMTMNVAGNTTISGTPAYVYFKKNFDGDLNFTTNNLTVSSGSVNYLLGPSAPTGAATVTVNNDFTVSGSSTKFWVNYAITNAATTTLNVGNDLTLTDGELTIANHLGAVDINITRNVVMSGSTSIFYGQRSTVALGDADFTVAGSVTLNDGTFIQSRGLGSTSSDITEYITLNNASFYGLNSTASGNNGIATLICSDLNLNGGKFYLHRGQVTDGRTINVTIANDVNVNFTSASDEVAFIGRANTNNAQLNLSIGGNLFLSGNTNAYFTTSVSAGNELIGITGDVQVSGGALRFNGNESSSSSSGHDLTGTVGGSFNVSAGSVCLSIQRGTTNWTISGNYNQTGGYVFHKYNSGSVAVTVNGDYNLSNGQTALYPRSNSLSTNNQTLTILGNATFSNATVTFDSCTTSTATHTIIFKGANVTMGDNTVFTHINHLSTRTVFGAIIYDRVGTINWNRTSANYDVRQVKQSVTSGTTLNVSGSTNDFMISSHSSVLASTNTTLTVNGTINMGTRMIAGRDQANYHSRVDINNGARLITAHTNGMYSGSAANSAIYPMIGGAFGMDYFLGASSTVEYNGTDTQIITGTGMGVATTTNHRYGNLDIAFQGTPDIEFAYPYDNNIFVRTGLILTSGELNLDDDHVTATGGRTLNILNGATITRTAGYIRSEVEDGTGVVDWNITTTGSFVFPFGYNSASYIPFTYQAVSGSSGDVLLGTYHSAANNTPYPPTVTHVNDLIGADNSGSTVDRFWRIEVPGNATANMVFSFTAAESSGISNPRAQLWEPVSTGWFPPLGAQSNPTPTTTQTNTNTTFNSWWTLSSAASPLPIQLLTFTASPFNRSVKLAWSTASELNNNFFTVQRSDRSDVFTDVLHIPGAGNSSTTQYYSAVDATPLPGVSYYRLKQTDYDGKTSYSNVRVVNMNLNVAVAVFPNPLRGTQLNIAVGEHETGALDVAVYDISGKRIQAPIHVTDIGPGGVATVNVKDDLMPGAYMVEVKTLSGVYRQRIVKE